MKALALRAFLFPDLYATIGKDQLSAKKMSVHLPILISMFPNKAMLDIDDIAKCLSLSKAHIYRLSSTKKLPFKTSELSDRVLVSIVEMANYLDGAISKKVGEEKPVVPIAVKRGRKKTSQKGKAP